MTATPGPLLPCLLACVAAGALPAAAVADNCAAAPARPALTVSVVQPERTQLTHTVAVKGNIAVWQEAAVGSQAPG